jgi:hypothetical protein
VIGFLNRVIENIVDGVMEYWSVGVLKKTSTN